MIVAFLANESGIEYSPEDSVSETTDISRDISSEDMQAVYHNKSNDVQVLPITLCQFSKCHRATNFYVLNCR